ncbi:MAG TPA: D-alanyl-D-alanine carboxypeptidase family protein [Haloplasmataceae bacterium]
MDKKKITIFLLWFLVVLCFFTKGNIKANQDEFIKGAKSAILIELNTGQVLYEKKSHEKLPPASMTKIMSTLLVLEALDKGQIKMTDIVTISEHAASYGGSQVYLEPGEQMSVEDLFKCMVIVSANDATVALAEVVSGSEEMFVEQMNQKVKELGLQNTHFVDPTGLSDFKDGHYSTAYDMAMMARELLRKYEDITISFSSIYEDYIRKDTDNPFWLVNTNKLVKHFPGIDGLKTGWTREAGYNLTATMRKDKMRLISVVMGEANTSQRNFETVKLLKYGFSQYECVEYKEKNSPITEYENMLFSPQKVKIVTKEPVILLTKKGVLPENYEERYTFSISERGAKVGDEVGKLELIHNGQVVYTVPLTIDKDLSKASFFDIMGRLLKNIFY